MNAKITPIIRTKAVLPTRGANARFCSMRRVQRTGAQLRILVVDDDADCAESLTALLRSEGILCEMASGGREGIAMATAWRPDVVIMDISMPECDGFEAAKALRSHDRTWDTGIVAHTALDEEDVLRHARSQEFDAYCQKGASVFALLILIGGMTGWSGKRVA